MSTRKTTPVPAKAWKICDRCKLDQEQHPAAFGSGNIRELGYLRDALDFQGSPVAKADGEGLDFCTNCTNSLLRWLGGHGTKMAP